MEDYTWEKEADVLGGVGEEGANELVEEYFKRLEYLESRKQVIDERTAAPLLDEEIENVQNMVLLYHLAIVTSEYDHVARTVTTGRNDDEFEHGVWKRRTRPKPRRVRIEEIEE